MQRYEDSEVLRLQNFNFLQMVVIHVMSILINRLAYIVHKRKELEQKKKICFQVKSKMSLNSKF